MKPPISSSSSSSSSAISFLSPRKIGLSPFLFTTLTSIIIFSILYKEGYTCIFQQRFNQFSDHDRPNTPLSSSSSCSSRNNNINGARVAEKWKWKDRESSWLRQPPFAVGEKGDQAAECDVFSGKWVKDELNRPLYEESECPYIQPQLTCQEHGRPDKDYQSWRWQPHSCSLPSFNATFMLERLRGKRMMFVGDSLNRGQYVSMVCLLQRVIPEKAKFMKTFDSLTVFRAEEYNATIEFYWAPFLLESNSDNAVIHRVLDRMIRKGSINKHGRHWKGVDILVFNTYLWWMTGKKMKFLEGSFDDEDKIIIEMETEDAYRLAITSMVNWLERNMDPEKTRVFFTSMSPYHEKSVEWGDEAGGNCYNQTTPIEDPSYWGSGSRKNIMQVIEEVFSESEVPITFLNITQLSEYRKDAHTSIYKKQWKPLTAEQLANPVSYADCVHWCLPGLQDTWNELLYAKLFYP